MKSVGILTHQPNHDHVGLCREPLSELQFLLMYVEMLGILQRRELVASLVFLVR